MEANQRRGEKGHRRSRSEGTGLTLDSLHSGFDLQEAAAAAGHLRTVSLDTSCASQFLQSLQLHDAQAMQGQLLDAKTAALDQQQVLQYAAASPRFAGPVDGNWQQMQAEGLAVSAGSKRAHSSNGRLSKDSLQEGKKESLHQHKHSFTPALPAVEEAAAEPSDRDDDEYDYDSDKGLTPRARRSGGGRGRGRRGGCNGRSENELLLLDPKRVKRIMANRQSAARSKERRMNYTVQLESKLQSLGTEMEKLSATVDGLQGQGKVLLQTRVELEQQLEGMQQQLSQTCSHNQVLISELFALQNALGLPQQLPQPDTASQAAAAAATAVAVAGGHHQQQCDMQCDGQYGSSWQYDAGYSQVPATVYGATVGNYPAAPAAAAAAGSTASARQGSATAASGIPPLPPQHIRSPTLSASPTVPQQQCSHQSPAMLQAGNSTCRAPGVHMQNAKPAAAAAAAGLGAAAVAGLAEAPMPSTAAAAADMLLLDEFVAGGADAALACVDDLDPDMLATLLDDAPEPAAAAAAAAAALPGSSAQQMDSARAAAVPQQQQQQQPFPVIATDPAAATAAQGTAGASVAGLPGGAPCSYTAAVGQPLPPTPPGMSSMPAAAAAAGHSQKPSCMVQVPVGHNSWSAQSSPGVGLMRPAAGYGRGSPAFSDPVGGEGYHEEVSSGSLGGSLTPSTQQQQHRMSDSSSMAATGVGSRQGGIVPPAFWQQQQQLGLHGTNAGFNTGSAAAGVAPAAAAAAGGGPGGTAGFDSQWGIQQRSTHMTPTDVAIQQQQHGFGLAAAGSGATQGTGLASQSSFDHINFVMGVNPAAKHWFGSGSHHRSASAGCATSMGWADGDRSWLSGLPSVQQQQQQHVGAAAAAGGRVSAPGSYSAFDFPGSSGGHRASSIDSMAVQQQQQQQQGMRQAQHRRSNSYAGSGHPATSTTHSFARPSSIGDGLTLHQQQQQQQAALDVHPAALGPNALAGVVAMPLPAAVTGGHGAPAAAAAAAGADFQALAGPPPPTATIETASAAAAAVPGATVLLQSFPL